MSTIRSKGRGVPSPLLAIVGSCLAGALFAQSQAPESDSTAVVRVGAVFPLTGDYATYGLELRQGLELAFSSVESAGLIEFVGVLNNRSREAQTAVRIAELIDTHRVDLLIGCAVTKNSVVAAEIAQNRKVPILIPAATGVHLTGIGEYVARICFTDEQQAQMCAAFAVKELSSKRTVVLWNTSEAYSTDLAKSYVQAVNAYPRERRPQLRTFTYRSTAAEDLQPVLRMIRRARPDLVFLPAYDAEAARLLVTMRRNGIFAPCLGGDGFDSPEFRRIAGPEYAGNYFCTHWYAEYPGERSQLFLRAYKARYTAEPTFTAALGYDAGLVALAASRLVEDGRAKDLVSAIRGIKKLQGVTGKLSMTRSGDPAKEAVILRTTERGPRLLLVSGDAETERRF